MTKIERVTVAFSEPIASQIRSAVDAGEYRSPNDVVQDALRLWSNARDADHLRKAWDAGKASGLLGPMSFDAVRQDARGQLEARLAIMDREHGSGRAG